MHPLFGIPLPPFRGARARAGTGADAVAVMARLGGRNYGVSLVFRAFLSLCGARARARKRARALWRQLRAWEGGTLAFHWFVGFGSPSAGHAWAGVETGAGTVAAMARLGGGTTIRHLPSPGISSASVGCASGCGNGRGRGSGNGAFGRGVDGCSLVCRALLSLRGARGRARNRARTRQRQSAAHGRGNMSFFIAFVFLSFRGARRAWEEERTAFYLFSGSVPLLRGRAGGRGNGRDHRN